MSQNVTKINAKQRKFIEELLLLGNVTQAASATGISRQTVYRWRQQPRFLAALRQAESEAMGLAMAGFAARVERALEALDDGLNKGQDISVRLRAAESVLSRLASLRELIEIESRMAALEKYYANE